MKPKRKTDEKPTAVELLTAEIIELKEDITELRRRLNGENSGPWDAERRARWEQTLGAVTAAIDERIALRLARGAP